MSGDASGMVSPLTTIGASQEAGAQHRATDKRMEKSLKEWKPSRFKGTFEDYLPIYQQIHAPMLKTSQDMAAIAGQNLEYKRTTAIGKRGLAGSGADIFGGQAVAGQTAATQNKNLMDFYSAALKGAESNARETRKGKSDVLMGTPITHKPSTSGTAMSALGGAAPTSVGK